jgi:HAMP domain-containing protein
MFNHLYFTDFAVGSLIPACFLLVMSVFLLQIKEKSRATLHLGIAWGFFGLIPSSYIFTSGLYDPSMAYLRWVNAAITILFSLHVCLFFFHFPETRRPTVAKWFMIIGWLFFLGLWLSFVSSTIHAGRVYRFSGHFWDLDADKFQELIARLILLSVVIVMVVGLWRSIVTKGSDKKIVLAIFLCFILGIIPPAVANVLSREGVISRATFIFIYNLFIVVFFSLVFLIYINNTKDKTSFLAKIIGISLVTFFLALQVITSFTLDDKERAFDEITRSHAKLIVEKDQKPSGDYKYLTKYSLTEDIFTTDTSQELALHFPSYRREYQNAYFYSEILNLPDDTFPSALSSLLEQSEPYLVGYISQLKDIFPTLSKKEILINYIHSLNSKVGGFKNKLLRSKDVQAVIQLCEKNKAGELRYFAGTILNLTTSQPDLDNLKKEALLYLTPLQPTGVRTYRDDKKFTKHYVSYTVINMDTMTLYEVGFDYLLYRKYIHPAALKFILILLSVVAFVILGFRVFFYGALLKPLNSLLNGLKDVHKGNLNAKIEVFVEDEIGYLTRSFNRMTRSIRAAKTRLQKYADELEDKVEQRTKELQSSLQEVQQLKTQQDGDYFLTSLLVKPLGKNSNTSKVVDIQFLVSQKKKFQFRKYSDEIGGDICISYSIQLKKKTYTVFINADAMGKSMQGAGGILILGSVFRSIVERTQLIPSIQDMFPEKWLKNAFIELHKVFESFDGSMLISLVMGSIEDETGLMYYINAEHPMSVLYRDGKACFIDDEVMFRKLGTMGMDDTIYVKTFQFEKDDIVILGSDGRDDILLSNNGTRVINEDETVFLRKVEEGMGDLNSIYQKLTELGELTDDLSLLRIEYKPSPNQIVQVETERLSELLKLSKEAYQQQDYPTVKAYLEEAHQIDPHHNKVIRYLINVYHKTKDYPTAEYYAEMYSAISPWEMEYLFMLSYFNKKIGDLVKAAEIGERLRIRNPRYVKNLINLVDIYLKAKNNQRAEQLLFEALKLEYDNPELLKYKEMLTGIK